MQDFEYNISVLVPVYNAQDTLVETIDSVLNQEIVEGFKYEILLINDGSSDESEEICLNFSNQYPFIKYLSHENRGVSYTRNRGLDLAKGKYILFLDADDLIANDTLSSVYETFEKYFDEADLLAYPLYRLIDGKIVNHPRTSTYKFTGVYDIDAYPHINQTTMNVIIKNLKTKNYFDENMSFAEDSFFNTKMITPKRKVILSSRGAYYYRINTYSAAQRFRSPANAAMPIINFFESLIKINDQNTNKTLKYAQSIIMYEINWRIKSNGLFPKHLSQEEYNEWNKRFYYILSYIEIDTIMSHPHIDYYHKIYFLNLKDQEIKHYVNDGHIPIIMDGYKISEIKNFQLVFSLFLIKDGCLHISGFIKNPFLKELQLNLKLIININGISEELLLYKSNYSYYKSAEFTNLFLQFDTKIPLRDTEVDIYFDVHYGGNIYPTTFYFKENTIIKTAILKRYELVNKNYLIEVSENNININMLKGIKGFIKKFISRVKLNKSIIKVGYLPLVLFKLIIRNIFQKEINLYSDSPSVYSEAYIKFKEGVKEAKGFHYYIYSESDGVNIYEKFTEKEQKNLVLRGSLQHKMLFIKANNIYSTSTKMFNYSPFSMKAYNLLAEYFKYDLIWLKLAAHNGYLPNIYSKEITNVNQIIVKSNKDKNILISMYNYLPDQIIVETNTKVEPSKGSEKILIAFTWRSYLAVSTAKSLQEMRLERFATSQYFKNLSALLNSDILNKIARDYEIDFYIHPKFQKYQDLFNKVNYSISFIKEIKNINEYSLLVTDYSQLTDTFEEREKSVLKYHLDFADFKTGNHVFNTLIDGDENYFFELERLLIEIENNVYQTNGVIK
ncbi:glycosyltransferase family 2 protein [Solibacillus sp. FSL K6-1523]|uniref:glycosyltransferase family 2 protein n=1 Tax=Solibacillus sp. FSL K6-1523 TaxID=2921471 RepID=UPI0030F7600A